MLARVTGILVPLCFLAFAVAVIRIQGTSTDPTAYGSHNCFRWRLETGARLRSPRHLPASRTVGGAALSIYTLPFGWLHIVLVLLSTTGSVGPDTRIVDSINTTAAWVPELLGYASTVLRDSRFVELDVEDGRLDGMDLTNKYG
ncbi:hypothetical protein MCOR07_007800 [Pyricularia oryzae]|nr:hypothetical protein MCOR01_007454 [Pyricularia oryzae]KAI6255077.1 hypothetical protein MCOR19_008425 [Pyricularia oryzae]KAI6322325.1 hypothetical protein MCOR29_004830 [Pyricularia oryzae]KAI6394747.1 hypothetical protein MCOR23_007380 [Pyricularia oryzae]KAI6400384.1 hypothetical protein MCOR20_008468 [Pyricularia oryzae]